MAKYYVVLKGVNPGVYDNWAECEVNTKGFKGAVFKSFASKEEAEIAFKTKKLNLNNVSNTENKTVNQINQDIKIETNSVCVDGACSGNPGKGEYQCVDTNTKEVIFKSKVFNKVTNNLMEFCALVEALIYLDKNKLDKKIYSDSITAIAWVRDKKAKSSVVETFENKELLHLVREYEEWLLDNNVNMKKILKWDTKILGEIPADFGRK